LRPFVTLLPTRTPVNLNTATPEVLVACIPNLDMAQARLLEATRDARHLGTLSDAEKRVGDAAIKLDAGLHAVSSRFFSVTGRLRVGQTTLQETSVLQRDGMDVKILSRAREVVQGSASLLQ
jgi:general secretion pathway protein K